MGGPWGSKVGQEMERACVAGAWCAGACMVGIVYCGRVGAGTW